MNRRRTSLKLMAATTAAAAVPTWARAQAEAPLSIGFVYVSPIGDAGWTFQHESGRRELVASFGDRIATRFVESVPEGPDAERVIREMAQSGARIVFATSFGYMNYVERVARSFPGTAFLHATGYKTSRNLGVYNGRFYEGRYLNGVIAGSMSKTGVLGYVGAFPIPEVLQGINAFTRGARSVNPKIEVRVIWVNSWYDPGREREAANTLMSQNADIVTHHTDSTAVVQAAEERGKWAFGYHSDMSKYGPNAQLSATTHHWGAFYRHTVEAVMAGNWTPPRLWGGMKDGVIRIAPINPVVPAEVRARVDELAAGIIAGSVHPFEGPVIDQDGKSRHDSGPMDDDTLGRMDYYVEGVASRLPRR
ncbi:MAG: BMP family ABC transporter substrate-binding protein [Burkholderiaceae bacterium]